MKTKQAVIVVPFYKQQLTDYEKIALNQAFNILSNYDIVAIKPASLTLPEGTAGYNFSEIVPFPDEYFRNIQGYNKLMLAESFYRTFLDYNYILIHQLDAFVFKDELSYWCDQKFDYIGAPWINSYVSPDIVKELKERLIRYYHKKLNIQANGLPHDRQFEFEVGNGGFSLRNTRKFYEVCRAMPAEINAYNARTEHQFNEDAFWSIEVNRKKKKLSIPGYKQALKFSIEMHPERAMIINNNKLPFGCHAWDLNNVYWRPFFKDYGYDI